MSDSFLAGQGPTIRQSLSGRRYILTTFRATPKLSTRRFRRNWFSGFGWLWSADRLRRRGLSRNWLSGFGWLWSADRLHQRGLSRRFNLWWHRCLPCGPTVGCRTKHPAISNNLPRLENLNSTFETVNCHFSFLLSDYGFFGAVGLAAGGLPAPAFAAGAGVGVAGAGLVTFGAAAG